MRALYAIAILEGLAILGLAFSLLARTPPPPVLEAVTSTTVETEEAAATAATATETMGSGVAADPVPAVSVDPAPATPQADDATPTKPAEAAHARDLGHVLYGSLRTSDGTSIRRANLSLRQEGGPEYGVWVDRSGTYAFAGLVPGTWQLGVQTDGCTSLKEDVAIDAGTRAQRHDVVLSPAPSVRVALVTPDGKPLRAAMAESKLDKWRVQVVATEAQPPAQFASQTSFSFGPLPLTNVGRLRRESGLPGHEQPLAERFFCQLDLTKPPPLFVSVFLGQVRLASAQVVAGQDEIELQIAVDECRAALSDVRLRLVDASTGQPIAKAYVNTDSMMPLRPEASGDVRLQRTAGRFTLSISADGYEQYALPIEVEPGRMLDLGDVALHQEGKAWEGVVLDAADQPVADANLYTVIRDGTATGPGAGTDPKGEFTLHGLGRRRYLVIASSEKAMDWTVLDGAVEPKRLELHLRPTVQVAFDTRLSEFETARVVVREPEGHVLWSTNFSALRKPSSMRLPPGNYDVEMRVGLGAPRSAPLHVTSTGATLVVSR